MGKKKDGMDRPGQDRLNVHERKIVYRKPTEVTPEEIVWRKKQNKFLRWLTSSAPRLITLSFALVILVGTVLLTLPIASADGTSVGPLKALFTSTSCTCVTGLIVGDTATFWSAFGHVVIIGLIQIGGLGLITIMSFFLVATRKKIGMRAMLAMQESIGSQSFSSSRDLVKKIIFFTLSCELIGGAVLTWRYALRMPFGEALRRGVFQGISAFCNAGFDLMGDFSGPFSSLTKWNDDPIVTLTTAFLIIIGGLGFVVWDDLLRLRKTKKLHFHSKLVLTMTIFLLAVGTVFFLFVEGNSVGPDSLGALPVWQRPFAAFFQSASLRTAGFNSIDQAGLSDTSKLMGCILMFIGAGPASTGGGVKITSIAVLFALITSYFRGRDETFLFKHRISRDVVRRALTIVFVGLTIVLVSSMLITLTEKQALRDGRFSFLDILYEVISGFATVGVTSAGTPTLSAGSWIVLIFNMYLGRVGPASFAMGLTFQQSSDQSLVYPESKTFVG
ncbi:MAG: TrkH family potassium uptake protein [Fastidiosipilaceae bacterium]|jgi:trk system potassium uptake protein TrkH